MDQTKVYMDQSEFFFFSLSPITFAIWYILKSFFEGFFILPLLYNYLLLNKHNLLAAPPNKKKLFQGYMMFIGKECCHKQIGLPRLYGVI